MNKRSYPYTGDNGLYTVIFERKDYAKCIKSKSTGLKVGYHGFCSETTFREIKEKNEMQNLKKDDIIIGSQLKVGGAVSFAKEPKVQANIVIAHDEAERLAKLDNTKKFVVVKVMGVCSVQNTHWE